MGAAAEFYINDNDKAHQFILECSEQCHVKGAKDLWGEKLLQDIMEYNNNMSTRTEP